MEKALDLVRRELFYVTWLAAEKDGVHEHDLIGIVRHVILWCGCASDATKALGHYVANIVILLQRVPKAEYSAFHAAIEEARFKKDGGTNSSLHSRGIE